MKNFRPTVAAVVMLTALFSPFFASAQHFEWAKGYSSSQESNFTKGTVTDSEGNLYILGHFSNAAAWDNEFLLPEFPLGSGVIIAKISPTGDMVWKKIIHSNNGQANAAMDIKKIGDSSFACLLQLALPSPHNYTYYLDTLILDESDYPVQVRYMMDYAICNAFIVFDFDGNVKEQHFINLTYTDINGEDILNHTTPPLDPTPWYCSSYMKYASFDMDSEGNIYISREANDWVFTDGQYYDVQVGTICGIKFWVDNRVAGYFPIAGDRPMKWYPQIVKFAPHFDTLLDCRYVIQGQSDSMEYRLCNTVTKVDAGGNVYHIGVLHTQGVYQGDSLVLRMHDNTLYIDSADDLGFYHTDNVLYKSFLAQYDSDLNPQWVVVIDDSVINQSQTSSMSIFHDLDFDYDSSLMFLSIYSNRGSNFYSIPTVGGIPLNIKNEAAVLAFKMTTGAPALHSVCVVPSIRKQSNIETYSRGNMICGKNRIFIQCQYYGGISLPHNNIVFNSIYDQGAGLVVFDYEGNVIDGIHYATSPSNFHPCSLSLQDSILYLITLLSSDAATFGDIQETAQWDNACVAKYVDTAFMTPYVHTGTPYMLNIVMGNDGDAFVVYPNPFRQRVTVRYDGGEELTEAYVTDLTGRSEQVQLKREDKGRYTVDLTARPQATCLLTLVTATGRRHTVRLLKQSDMFGF